MSNLSPVISQPTEELQRLMSEIMALRRHRRKGRESPHKLILLLSVLDCFDSGEYHENKIYLSPYLVSRFQYYFSRFRRRGAWPQIGPPFFHLRTAPFWHHQIRKGRESFYATLSTSGGGTRRISETIEYAYFSDYAYTLVADPSTRYQLHAFLEELLWREWLDGRGD